MFDPMIQHPAPQDKKPFVCTSQKINLQLSFCHIFMLPYCHCELARNDILIIWIAALHAGHGYIRSIGMHVCIPYAQCHRKALPGNGRLGVAPFLMAPLCKGGR